jgi:hypothetical protein
LRPTPFDYDAAIAELHRLTGGDDQALEWAIPVCLGPAHEPCSPHHAVELLARVRYEDPHCPHDTPLGKDASASHNRSAATAAGAPRGRGRRPPTPHTAGAWHATSSQRSASGRSQCRPGRATGARRCAGTDAGAAPGRPAWASRRRSIITSPHSVRRPRFPSQSHGSSASLWRARARR